MYLLYHLSSFYCVFLEKKNETSTFALLPFSLFCSLEHFTQKTRDESVSFTVHTEHSSLSFNAVSFQIKIDFLLFFCCWRFCIKITQLIVILSVIFFFLSTPCLLFIIIKKPVHIKQMNTLRIRSWERTVWNWNISEIHLLSGFNNRISLLFQHGFLTSARKCDISHNEKFPQKL